MLIPVIDRGDEATVLLTQRAEKLRSHSGQVAFPGGRIDPTDASPEDAALARDVRGDRPAARPCRDDRPDAGLCHRLAATASCRCSASSSRASSLSINEHEVDAAFEVPLGFLMDPANHQRDSRIWLERERFYYDMPYGDRRIWGVTAGIIRTLYERLYA